MSVLLPNDSSAVFLIGSLTTKQNNIRHELEIQESIQRILKYFGIIYLRLRFIAGWISFQDLGF